VDQPARRSVLELFLAGVDEDGVPLNGPCQLGVTDLTVAKLLLGPGKQPVNADSCEF
jgi:hypothetical protein